MKLLRNGKSDEELRQERRDEQLHQMNLSAADAEQPMDTAYIQQMTDHDLQDETVDMLSNLLDRDFMLGNLSEAEVHEYRWLARVMTLEIEALHPNRSGITRASQRYSCTSASDRLPSMKSRSSRFDSISTVSSWRSWSVIC